MHHHDAAVAHPGVKYSGTKADEAFIPDISRTVNQSHVSNAGLIANPDRVLLAIIANDPTFLQPVNDDPILNIRRFTNIKWSPLVSPNRSTRGNQYICPHFYISN